MRERTARRTDPSRWRSPRSSLDVVASQRILGFVVGSHLVSSFVEMKLALAQEEESQRTVHGEAVAGVPERNERRECQ